MSVEMHVSVLKHECTACSIHAVRLCVMCNVATGYYETVATAVPDLSLTELVKIMWLLCVPPAL